MMKRNDVKVRPHPTLEEIFAAAAKTVPTSRVPPHPPAQAHADLLALLDRLEILTGIPGSQAERDEVAERIMDVFHQHPDQAAEWQRAWKALHPTQAGEEARR
jgi:hypothetical protein